MVDYVLGFLFSADRSKICLMHKTKPAHLAGKFNGLGGNINPNEDPLNAMQREFLEETGVEILDWNYIGQIEEYGKWNVRIFNAFSDKIFDVKTMESEIVGVFDVDKLYELPIVNNLKWLVPYALDKNKLKMLVYYENLGGS